MDVASWLRSLASVSMRTCFATTASSNEGGNHEKLHVDGGIARCRIAGKR